MYTVLFDGMHFPKFFSVRDKYHLQYHYELLSLKHTTLPPAVSSVLYFCYTKLIHIFAKQQYSAFVFGAHWEYLAAD